MTKTLNENAKFKKSVRELKKQNNDLIEKLNKISQEFGSLLSEKPDEWIKRLAT